MTGGAGVLDARGRDGGQAEQGRGERARVELALGFAARDIAVVQRLDLPGADLRVDDRLGGGLGKQLPTRAIVFAELRDAHSDHGDAAHDSSWGWDLDGMVGLAPMVGASGVGQVGVR